VESTLQEDLTDPSRPENLIKLDYHEYGKYAYKLDDFGEMTFKWVDEEQKDKRDLMLLIVGGLLGIMRRLRIFGQRDKLKANRSKGA
jgi:hypothetical protein